MGTGHVSTWVLHPHVRGGGRRRRVVGEAHPIGVEAFVVSDRQRGRSPLARRTEQGRPKDRALSPPVLFDRVGIERRRYGASALRPIAHRNIAGELLAPLLDRRLLEPEGSKTLLPGDPSGPGFVTELPGLAQQRRNERLVDGLGGQQVEKRHSSITQRLRKEARAVFSFAYSSWCSQYT